MKVRRPRSDRAGTPHDQLPVLRRGLSDATVDGRIPVDVGAEQRVHFSAETRVVLSEDAANQRIF